MAKETVIIEGRRYFVCSVCQRPLEQGYDSPANPADVLCGPHLQEAFAVVYQSELAAKTATLPEVASGLLPGHEELPVEAEDGGGESGNAATRLLRRVRPGSGS